MLEAFDTLLEAKVSSYDAAKNSRDEFFRYECAYCGEDNSRCWNCFLNSYNHYVANTSVSAM